MNDLTWSTIRDDAIAAFGTAPTGPDEEPVLAAFQEHPHLVLACIEDVKGGVHAGRIRSPWRFLRTMIERAATTADVTSAPNRDSAISNAEQWIKTAGVHYDRRSEIEDDLFGDTGKLRHYRDDHDLRERLLALWESERPRGQQTEREELERVEAWKAWKARERLIGKPKPPEPEPAATHDQEQE